MSSKFQTVLLVCITIVVVMLFLRRPEKQIPIVQDIEVIQPGNRSITVSSWAEVDAKLDTAEFKIVLEVTEKELADAKMKSEEAFQQAVNILQNHGVDVKDIKDSMLHVDINKSYGVDSKILGYDVIRTVKVTLHSIEELDPLFMELEGERIYKISDIVLSISNVDDFRDRALQLAMEKADKKAKAVARGINKDVGQVISIDTLDSLGSNNTNPSYVYTYSSLDGFFGRSGLGWQAPYTGPDVTIMGQVTVKYELK